MPIAPTLLPEFDAEMQRTRALLACVPDALADWKPHPKSMSMSQLAIHIPGLVTWIPGVFADTELDVAGPSSKRLGIRWESAPAAMRTFDDAVVAGRAAIQGASDEAMMVPWTLRAGDHVIVTMPRVAVLRTLVMNHIIHHRGQLSVYLRLNDIALPEIYGPTADSVR
ncbi:MAG: DinB family protein [Gemmatimonadetes bacterium]|nr:DinB family protein [Gemmatimonadota bacterium]